MAMRREPVRALTGEVAAIRRLETLLEGAESASLLIGGEDGTVAELPASVLGACGGWCARWRQAGW